MRLGGTIRLLLPGLAGLAGLGLLAGLGPLYAAEPGVPLSGGTTTIVLNHHLLDDLGGSIRGEGKTEPSEGALRFDILDGPESVLTMTSEGSGSHTFTGYLVHQGGFELAFGELEVSLEDFEIRPGAPPYDFALWTRDGTPVFWLDHPHPQRFEELGQFAFLNMDLRFTDELAFRLGRRDLAGLAVGRLDLVVNWPEGRGGPESGTAGCFPNFDNALEVDVELSAMSSLSEVAHDATRVAIAPAATVWNVGDRDVEWYRSIAPDGWAGADVVGQHPMLVMNFYRIADGTIRQLGASDIKHTFFSANTAPCSCQSDQVLFVNCTDLYGANTNANRKFLAPRDEVNPFTLDWIGDPNGGGSHFDGTPANEAPEPLRSHDSGDHDDFEHRLVVQAADLTTAGAEYLIESWYLAKDDVNLFNSIGYRKTAPSFSTFWDFPLTSALELGPAIDAWVDPLAPPAGAANDVVDTGEGRLELAVRSELLPSGLYRYEYALMNLDFDRQISSFSIPLPAAADVLNLTFHDIDTDGGNDWPAAAGASDVSWTAPAGNGLDWGTLYNFGLTTNVAPDTNTVTLGFLEPGATSQISPASIGPGATAIPTAAIAVTLTGAGSVASSPAGITCGADCQETFADGMPIELAATPTGGSAFVRWEEAAAVVAHDTDLEFVAGADRTLDAHFTPCQAVVDLPPQTVTETQVFAACSVLSAGLGFEVSGPSGEAIFRSGSSVELADGFSVSAGGTFRIEIIPEQVIP